MFGHAAIAQLPLGASTAVLLVNADRLLTAIQTSRLLVAQPGPKP